MMWGYGQGMGWMWLWSLLLLIGIALLMWLVVLVSTGGVRSRQGQGGQDGRYFPSGRDTARQILDERFARGELTADEYRERLRILNEGR
jgi:putative membrane protein